MTTNTDNPEPELAPCPLCPDGGKPYFAKSVNGTNMVYVGCSQCGLQLKAQVQFLTSRDDWRLSKDIVSIWNTRSRVSASPAATATAPSPLKAYEVCAWKYDPDGYWQTQCGDQFCFSDGGPTENRVNFCHFCGRSMFESAYANEQEGPHVED